MRIFKLRSMKTINLFALLTALLFSSTIWAEDYSVGTENELRSALTDGANIQLTTDIQLNEKLVIDGKNITNPIFSGTTISSNKTDIVSKDGKVSFKSTYGPVTLTGGDASNLFLVNENLLYWPTEDCTIQSFRAYFHVDLGPNSENPVKAFHMNLGDDATSIQDLQLTINNSGFTIHNDSDAWYDLQGRRIAKPANGQLPKGIYIHGGKAVVVK